MTRSITIVNTSNWDGEDYEFEITKTTENTGEKHTVSLKPGEKHILSPYAYQETTIAVKATESKKPEPFYLNGRQVLPDVAVGFK